jgi:hypothetical protein
LRQRRITDGMTNDKNRRAQKPLRGKFGSCMLGSKQHKPTNAPTP